MTEMNRLRIFEEDEKFFIRRKVRNDWFPVIGKDGKELCADNYDKMRFVEMQCNRINTVNKKIMPFKRLNDDLQSLNSYTGFAAHTNCYGKTKKILFKYKKIYNFAFLKRNKHVLKMRSYFKIGEILYEKDTLERNRMSARLHGEA